MQKSTKQSLRSMEQSSQSYIKIIKNTAKL